MDAATAWSLRPATEDDLKQVLQIEKAVHPAPWEEAAFRAEFTKPYSHFLVLTDDETDAVIAGYVVFWAMFDECQILDIVVDLPHRGLGFAKRMIRQVVSVAAQKNAKRVILDVRKSNQPAIELYQKTGFAITSRRKGFYSNGEDAYQMSLEMDGKPLDF